jgi:hypothetical protein
MILHMQQDLFLKKFCFHSLRTGIPDIHARRCLIVCWLCSVFITGTQTVTPQCKHETTEHHLAAEDAASVLKALSPYIVQTGSGAMTIVPDHPSRQTGRSLEFSTAYLDQLARWRKPDHTVRTGLWSELPVIGVEVSEKEDEQTYLLSSVKFGFLRGHLWVVFESLEIYGESVSARWRFNW